MTIINKPLFSWGCYGGAMANPGGARAPPSPPLAPPLVWSVLNIFHPPFIETQSLVSSAKCGTCHMALPLKIMHFRLCVGLCTKYCGALSDVNHNYFTHFISCLECPEHIPTPFY